MEDEYKPLYQIISIEILNSKNSEECHKIIKEKAKPGDIETNVAASILLAHSINNLAESISKINSFMKMI